jgi:hypothetical protein
VTAPSMIDRNRAVWDSIKNPAPQLTAADRYWFGVIRAALRGRDWRLAHELLERHVTRTAHVRDRVEGPGDWPTARRGFNQCARDMARIATADGRVRADALRRVVDRHREAGDG